MEDIAYCYRRLLYAIENQDNVNRKSVFVFYSLIDGLPIYICGNMRNAEKVFHKDRTAFHCALLRKRKGCRTYLNYEIFKIDIGDVWNGNKSKNNEF